MRELLAPAEPKFTIDTKGTIIFTLPDGGVIRDNGNEIHFSMGSEAAKTLADQLAQAKRRQMDRNSHSIQEAPPMQRVQNLSR